MHFSLKRLFIDEISEHNMVECDICKKARENQIVAI